MFFKETFNKRTPRKFQFTPYYYREEGRRATAHEPRIKFQRIRHGGTVSKKSLRGLLLLAIFVLICLIYFWRLIVQDTRTFDIEGIKIEETPN